MIRMTVVLLLVSALISCNLVESADKCVKWDYMIELLMNELESTNPDSISFRGYQPSLFRMVEGVANDCHQQNMDSEMVLLLSELTFFFGNTDDSMDMPQGLSELKGLLSAVPNN